MATFTNEIMEKLCCVWEEEESLWNVSCEAYHKKDQRQNSLLKIQEILKRDMAVDFTGMALF
jgi:hypothetical protein